MAARKPSHAGSWYAGSAQVLSSTLAGYLSKVQPFDLSDGTRASFPDANAKAIIAPHAGYDYSGPAAAWAYASLPVHRIKRIFVLGPSHHIYMAHCALSLCTSYDTPCGRLALDMSIIQALRSTGKFSDLDLYDDEAEHSVEMHLPYLVHIFKSQNLPTPPIIPIVVGSISSDKERMYGEILAPYFKEEGTFFVISSDFCHWGSRFDYTRTDPTLPGGSPIWQSIASLDRSAMEAISFPSPTISLSHVQTNSYFSPLPSLTTDRDENKTATKAHEEFVALLKKTKNTVCGRHPIGVLLATLASLESRKELGEGINTRWVRYEQSEKVTSGRGSSVSYASAVFTLDPTLS